MHIYYPSLCALQSEKNWTGRYVRLRLPRLAIEPTKLNTAAKKLQLRIRGTEGEQHIIRAGVLDVCNRRTLGINEIDTVRELVDGVNELIKMEKFS
ncbi:Arginine kinase [Amphibalanus amphitrite]|uniref:arginine kinase n=1 Tax=Amphibalanus amphitrite TaxID=1232801 RepID=A0A6A4WLR7_AMPAM|nr:Arginine kinase [Amphibalanus amphitrite]